MRGIAVEKKEGIFCVVCESPLHTHQIAAFEAFSGIPRDYVEFITDPTQYADVRKHMADLRRHYYWEPEERCGCTDGLSYEPNLTPQPALCPECPQLDHAAVSRMFPGHMVEWRMIPIVWTEEQAILVCERPVSDEKRKHIECVYNFSAFEFVDDSARYPEVHSHLDHLLAHHSWQPYFLDGFLLGGSA